MVLIPKSLLVTLSRIILTKILTGEIPFIILVSHLQKDEIFIAVIINPWGSMDGVDEGKIKLPVKLLKGEM